MDKLATQREGDSRNDGVDGGEAQVEYDIVAKQVAVEIGKTTARRRGHMHHADGEYRGKVEQQDQPEADREQH